VKGNLFLKAVGIARGFFKRWAELFFKIPFYKYIFIHRESAPLGPPLFEWIICKSLPEKNYLRF
jgi:hypothetical protein